MTKCDFCDNSSDRYFDKHGHVYCEKCAFERLDTCTQCDENVPKEETRNGICIDCIEAKLQMRELLCNKVGEEYGLIIFEILESKRTKELEIFCQALNLPGYNDGGVYQVNELLGIIIKGLSKEDLEIFGSNAKYFYQILFEKDLYALSKFQPGVYRISEEDSFKQDFDRYPLDNQPRVGVYKDCSYEVTLFYATYKEENYIFVRLKMIGNKTPFIIGEGDWAYDKFGKSDHLKDLESLKEQRDKFMITEKQYRKKRISKIHGYDDRYLHSKYKPGSLAHRTKHRITGGTEYSWTAVFSFEFLSEFDLTNEDPKSIGIFVLKELETCLDFYEFVSTSSGLKKGFRKVGRDYISIDRDRWGL